MSGTQGGGVPDPRSQGVRDCERRRSPQREATSFIRHVGFDLEQERSRSGPVANCRRTQNLKFSISILLMVVAVVEFLIYRSMSTNM